MVGDAGPVRMSKRVIRTATPPADRPSPRGTTSE